MNLDVDNALLTIVVPVHNMSGRLANLSKWLDDARSQNVKVILIHDKSEDSTGTELLNLLTMKNSKNVSLLEVNAKSPGLARNRGLEIVDTPWFSFADSDDFVYISSVLSLLNETRFSGCEIGIGSYISTDLRIGEEKVFHPPEPNDEALPLHLAKKMGLWRLVLSTNSVGDIRFTDHKMGEDYLYTNLVLNRTSQIFTSSRIVYKYYYGGNSNLTSNQSVMSDMIGIVRLIKSIRPIMSPAREFRIFSMQKLTLSVLKNLKAKEKAIEKTQLLINLVLHPIYLLKLLFPEDSMNLDK